MAIAFVQGTTGNNTTGTATGTFGSNTTSTNLIVVTTSDDSGTTANGVNITDNKGNTYTKVIHQASGSTISMWYCPNVTGGASHIVTATWSTAATGRLTFAAQEFSGVATSSPLDQSAFAGGSSTTPSVNSGSTTQADELVVGGLTRDGATSAITLGAGYTNLSTVNAANAGVAQESKVVSSTGVQTVTFSIAASRVWIAGVLTFKGSTAAPQTLSPSAIGSGEAFGTAVISPGGVTVSPSGVASAQTFGTAAISSTIIVSPSGVASGEAFGTPALTTGPPLITPTGIASAEAFGAPVITPGPMVISPAGISSAEDFGTPTLTGLITITPAGIASAEAHGTPTITRIDPVYRLIPPIIEERMGDHIAFLHRIAMTVYGNDSALVAKELPKAHELEGAIYVFYGGHEYTTTDQAFRDFWLSQGFEVERVV